MLSMERSREQGLLSKLFSVFLCIALVSGCCVPTVAFADDSPSSSPQVQASGDDAIARAPGMGIA